MATNFSVATIFTAKDRITQAFKRMGRGADDFGNRADKAFRKASMSGSRFRDVTKGILAASGIQFGIFQLGEFRREIIETGKTAQALDVVFRTVFGQSAANEMKFVRTEAERLGLQFDVVAKEYSKVAAATKGTTLEGKSTRELFIAMSEASTALQLSADDTGGALRALTQIISKGKVQAEELRGQLGERIPGAFKLAAQAMGVTQAELNKLMETGNLAANDFIPKFTKALRNEFGKSAMDASGSFQSAENRFRTAMFDFRKSFGKILLPIMTKFFQVATKITKPIADFIEANSDLINQNIDKVFKSIGDTFGELVKAGRESGLFDSIGSSLKELIPLIRMAFDGFKMFVNFASNAGLFDLMATGFRLLAKSIKFASNALGLILKLITPIFDGLSFIIKPFAKIAGFAIEIVGALTKAAALVIDFSGDSRTESEKKADELMKKHSEKLRSGQTPAKEVAEARKRLLDPLKPRREKNKKITEAATSAVNFKNNDRRIEAEKKAEETRKRFSEKLKSKQAPNKEVAEAKAKALQVNVGGKFTFENPPPGMNFVQTREHQMKTLELGAQ